MSESIKKKIGIPIATIASALLLMAPAIITTGAFAVSPHFTKGPTLEADGKTITVSGKGAGFGNAPTSAFITADVTQDFRCRNPGGNFAPGHAEVTESQVSPSEPIAVRNGQITFSVSLTAEQPEAPTPQEANCPNGNWDVVPVSPLTISNIQLHIQQNGQDLLSHTFPDVIDP
jgi:hypothetical protein